METFQRTEREIFNGNFVTHDTRIKIKQNSIAIGCIYIGTYDNGLPYFITNGSILFNQLVTSGITSKYKYTYFNIEHIRLTIASNNMLDFWGYPDEGDKHRYFTEFIVEELEDKTLFTCRIKFKKTLT